ncbi:MAG TPA: glycosyltransferase [Gemmatimonadaceae bacterium]|jgi:glycosyltransferase involved in cell wall biosynthesis|nr:glycosyltransferase [Gemmatimonadaceae bacterium]
MAHGPPFVSIIIPTYNRASRLRPTVESLAAQNYPSERFEIILVDNSSTDETQREIAKLAEEFPRIRQLLEQRRGAHWGRNAGATVSLGEILYFTDDDMIAEPEMLAKLVEPFERGDNVGVATGKVLPRWETEPPVWVLEHCKNALLSLNDLGEGVIISDDDPGVYSCHQAVLRDAFFRAGGFNPDTNAGEFVGDNETGLNIKLKKLGYRFAYVGEAVTHHLIPESRMTQEYVNSRFADQGYCDSYTDYRKLHPGSFRLVRRIAAHGVLTAATVSRALLERAVGMSRWRIDMARRYYYRNRARYDLRLLLRDEWRTFALRDNWITDDAQTTMFPRQSAPGADGAQGGATA